MDTAVATLSQYLPPAIARLLVAVVILLIGWVVSLLLARLVNGLLKRIQLDNRIAKGLDAKEGEQLPVERWVGTLVFWLVMLFFIVTALDVLEFTSITGPLNVLLDQIIAFLPKLLTAAILALVAHVIGSIARRLVTTFAGRRNVDARLQASAGTDTSVATPLGDAAYYLIWLFFLPAILGALGLESLLVPVQNMVDQFLSFLPFLAAAAILLIVGWFVARIVQRIVTGFLASAGVDGFAERVGLARYMGGMTLSRLLGLLVFIVILIPIITASLEALQLESLTAPLTAMINEVVVAIPSYVAAVAILVITYVVARWLIGIGVEILSGIGVNSIPRVLGLSSEGSIGGRTLAQWIGDIALLVVMLLAAVQAAQVIGWDAVTIAIGSLGTQIVQIIFGLVVIAIGVYLANLAARFIGGTKAPNKRLLAMIARVAIIAFAGAMGLTAMGFAESIVVIAFALFVGAIAIAVALAFGLGGRETAGKQVAEWTQTLKEERADESLPPADASSSTQA